MEPLAQQWTFCRNFQIFGIFIYLSTSPFHISNFPHPPKFGGRKRSPKFPQHWRSRSIHSALQRKLSFFRYCRREVVKGGGVSSLCIIIRAREHRTGRPYRAGNLLSLQKSYSLREKLARKEHSRAVDQLGRCRASLA